MPMWLADKLLCNTLYIHNTWILDSYNWYSIIWLLYNYWWCTKVEWNQIAR